MGKSWWLKGVLVLGLASVGWGQTEEHYTVQAEGSTLAIKVGRAGLFKLFGHDHLIAVDRYAGEMRWRPDAKETSSVRLEIDATSLRVADPEVDETDRRKIQEEMETKVLETPAHPVIHFESKGIRITKVRDDAYEARLRGELLLHGVRRELEIPLRFAFAEEGRLRVWGQFKLKGSDFGIRRVSVAGGTVKTKDTLEITFDFIATRQY